jgi:hypothetical protein
MKEEWEMEKEEQCKARQRFDDDVFYAVWRRGGNTALIDPDRVEKGFWEGVDPDRIGDTELHFQRQKKGIASIRN